ncbi:MAG: helix-hairpin-helix domain-containing protein [Bryobacteraceae bacterium]|jgi:competence ComEA-like helix-hairpin-helix protein
MNRLTLIVPFVISSLVPLASAQDLPEGKGKDVVDQICSSCHGPDLITSRRATKEEWNDIVGDMVSRGASATSEQIQTIKDYLTKYFGQVNANKAPSSEIATILDITPAQADAIVKYRTDHGAFKTIDDLKKVPELASANLDMKKDRLIF